MKKVTRSALPRGFSEIPAPVVPPVGDEALIAAVNDDLRAMGGLTLRNADGTPRETLMPGDIERRHSEQDRAAAVDRLIADSTGS